LNRIPVTFAKLAALYKELKIRLAHWSSDTVTPEFGEYFERYSVLNNQLRQELPNLYSDLPIRKVPREPNVCLLHEEGTNILSNIHGLVYIPFPKGLVSATFGVLSRELRVAFAKMR
jgi:hypothetical protein